MKFKQTINLHLYLLPFIPVTIPVTIPFQTTGARESIDEPAINQIWSEMTTQEKVVSDQY